MECITRTFLTESKTFGNMKYQGLVREGHAEVAQTFTEPFPRLHVTMGQKDMCQYNLVFATVPV